MLKQLHGDVGGVEVWEYQHVGNGAVRGIGQFRFCGAGIDRHVCL